MKPGSRKPSRAKRHGGKGKPGARSGRRPGPRGGKGVGRNEASQTPRTPAEGPIRLNRYIAQSGVSSRRKADEMIVEGLVKVNGKVVTEMGMKVQPGDLVEVNGKRITPRAFDYFILNKPPDTITTTNDERDRKTVMDLFNLEDEEKEGLYPVGRLDRHTKGVLIVTNDGELAHRLMHPSYSVDKLYRVETKEPVTPAQIQQLIKGIDLEDGKAAADDAAYIQGEGDNVIGMRLHQGKNRQIRRMMEALGHEVKDLERVAYAGMTTKGIRRGRWRRLTQNELKRLRRIVKLI